MDESDLDVDWVFEVAAELTDGIVPPGYVRIEPESLVIERARQFLVEK